MTFHAIPYYRSATPRSATAYTVHTPPYGLSMLSSQWLSRVELLGFRLTALGSISVKMFSVFKYKKNHEHFSTNGATHLCICVSLTNKSN